MKYLFAKKTRMSPTPKTRGGQKWSSRYFLFIFWESRKELKFVLKNHEKTWKILHLSRIKSRKKLRNVLGKNVKVLEFVGDPLVTTLSYGFRQIFYNHFKTGGKDDS